MMGFRETVKVALRLPHAKCSAAVTVLGPIAAFLVAALIPDRRMAGFLMMGIIFVTSIFVERFCTYIKAVRMEDMRRNGQAAGSGRGKRKRKKH